MEQKIKRIFYPLLDGEISSMERLGYIIKQISGASTNDYVWVLFEKNKINEINNTI